MKRLLWLLAVAAVSLVACGDDPAYLTPATATVAVAAVAPTPTPAPIEGSIVPPRKVEHVAPVYPADARQQRAQGVVILDVVIDVQGRVREPRVVRSPHPSLSEASLISALQWEYEPALLNGRPIPVVMTLTFTYTLQ